VQQIPPPSGFPYSFWNLWGERRFDTLKGDVREREHLEDPGVDRRIILKWIFRMCDVGLWNGSIWFRIVTCGWN